MVISPAATAELVTSGLVFLGLAVLVAAGVIHWLKGRWIKTSAVVYAIGNQKGLRWHNQRNELREVYVTDEEVGFSVPGTELTIYYEPRKASSWTLENPHRLTPILAGVGGGIAFLGTAVSLLDFFE